MTIEETRQQLQPPPDSPPVPTAIRARAVKDPWLCSGGHLMGMFIRKDGEETLYVTRVAYYPDQFIPESSIFATIKKGTVGCSICGEVVEYAPGHKRH